MAIQIIITQAGRAAIINAQATGTAAVVLSQVGFGTGSAPSNESQTALQNEIKRVSTISGTVTQEGLIHVTARDASSDVYEAKEFGVFTSTGILFAVYSQSTPIITKAAETVAMLAIDIAVTNLPAGTVTVGDVGFSYPSATESIKGVSEIATQAETDAGNDDERSVTPKKLKGNFPKIIRAVMETIYPVGEIYITRRDGNPSDLLGFGTWVRHGEGRALVGYQASDSDFNAIDKTGGLKSVTLSVSEIPAHNHTVDPPATTTSSSGAHIHGYRDRYYIEHSSTVATATYKETAPANYNNNRGPDGSDSDNTTFLYLDTSTESSGAHTHTLDISQFNSGNTGGAGAHNNLQPYITIYMWRRTA